MPNKYPIGIIPPDAFASPLVNVPFWLQRVWLLAAYSYRHLLGTALLKIILYLAPVGYSERWVSMKHAVDVIVTELFS